MKAWLGGLSVVAALVALVGWLVPDEAVRRPMWIFIFAMLAACSAFAWSHPESPKSPSGWLRYASLALAGGFVLTGVDALLFAHGPAGASFKDASLNSGWVLVDLAAIGGGVIVAAGGWAYSVMRKQPET